MVHLVYCDPKSKELSKIKSGEKTMVIRGAKGRKIPHSRVFEDDIIYFMEKGTKRIEVYATVTKAIHLTKLTDEAINETLAYYQHALNLTDAQKERWHKPALCLVEFQQVEITGPFIFKHQKNMDDWLILDQIDDVLEGTSKPYTYEKSRF